MRYRLLALDLDGTLFDRRKAISPCNLAAIRSAQQAGLRVLVATARLPHTARPFAAQIGAAKPMVACVGAWNIMPDGSDDQTLFEPEVVRRFSHFADAEGLNLSITDAEARVILRWADTERSRRLDVDLPAVEFVTRIQDHIPPRVVRLFSGETRSAQRLLDRFGEEMRGRVRFYRTATDGVLQELHVVPAQAGKDTALERICQRLGIAAGEVAAMGDSETDLDMIRWAGLGIAVADAMPEVRAAADLVAPASHEDAVAWTINRLLRG